MKPFLHRSLFAAMFLPLLSCWGAEVPLTPAPISWGDQVWQLQLDPATGALVEMKNKTDPHHMDWLRTAGHWEQRDWKPDLAPGVRTLDGEWGLVSTAQTGLLHLGKVSRVSERTWEAVYSCSMLSVTIRRELDASGALVESYTFKNTGVLDLELPVGSVSISAPFFDQYPDAQESLARRCHVHVWAGGASAWVNALRMGTGGSASRPSCDARQSRGVQPARRHLQRSRRLSAPSRRHALEAWRKCELRVAAFLASRLGRFFRGALNCTQLRAPHRGCART